VGFRLSHFCLGTGPDLRLGLQNKTFFSYLVFIHLCSFYGDSHEPQIKEVFVQMNLFLY